MSTRLILVGALLVVGIGCRKPATSAATESPAASAGSAKAEAATDEAQTLAALGELTQAVRKYAAEQQRVPKSLDEVVAAGYLSSTPAAPVGKKFVIDKNFQVYLTK